MLQPHHRILSQAIETATCFHQEGNLDQAETLYAAVLAAQPDHFDALHMLGVVRCQQGRNTEALDYLRAALNINPSAAEAWSNIGFVYRELNQPENALASCEHAVSLKPAYADALNNRGNALADLCSFDRALASYDKAIALSPRYAEPLNNRGRAFMSLNRPEEALASYEDAIALRPDYAEAHHGRSLCRLLQGDYARGWREYEWRWKTEAMKSVGRGFTQPLWLGDEDISGRTILLHGEQGIGDAIQFCRYVKLVLERSAAVILEVPSELLSLMGSLGGPHRIIARGDRLPDFDYHCPLSSLPLVFKTTLDSIPAEFPYLRAPMDQIELWRRHLGPHTKPRIGLVWAGKPRSRNADANWMDRQRSIVFDQLIPLLEETQCDFYSLQKGGDAAAQLRCSALGGRVIDWTDELWDFSDTAALIENLDLVISVDTAVAHLAGALGKPFWLLNRFNTCWRWMLDRDDSPWYPSALVFRQPSHGDWASVITRVASELRLWCARYSVATRPRLAS